MSPYTIFTKKFEIMDDTVLGVSGITLLAVLQEVKGNYTKLYQQMEIPIEKKSDPFSLLDDLIKKTEPGNRIRILDVLKTDMHLMTGLLKKIKHRYRLGIVPFNIIKKVCIAYKEHRISLVRFDRLESELVSTQEKKGLSPAQKKALLEYQAAKIGIKDIYPDFVKYEKCFIGNALPKFIDVRSQELTEKYKAVAEDEALVAELEANIATAGNHDAVVDPVYFHPGNTVPLEEISYGRQLVNRAWANGDRLFNTMASGLLPRLSVAETLQLSTALKAEEMVLFRASGK